MTHLDTSTHLFTPAQAMALATQLNADDEDWTYVVEHDPTGKGLSKIVVMDEHGELIGQF